MLAAVFYVVAGALHFIKPEPYLRIMPPYIPWHVAMVRVSGVSEILGGLGLLVPETRRTAAWGLTAPLIAVFPANIHMATNPIDAGAFPSRLHSGGGASLCRCFWSCGCSGARSSVRCSVEAANARAAALVGPS